MECNLKKIDVISFIDSNDKFNLKCERWKDVKTYKIIYKKEYISDYIKEIDVELNKLNTVLNEYTHKLKDIFIKEILENKPNSIEKKNIQKHIKNIINKIETLEISKKNIGIIKPTNVKYITSW